MFVLNEMTCRTMFKSSVIIRGDVNGERGRDVMVDAALRHSSDGLSL